MSAADPRPSDWREARARELLGPASTEGGQVSYFNDPPLNDAQLAEALASLREEWRKIREDPAVMRALDEIEGGPPEESE